MDKPFRIREFRLIANDKGDTFIFDRAQDAYACAKPGDVVEEWVKCSSHVVLEEEVDEVNFKPTSVVPHVKVREGH